MIKGGGGGVPVADSLTEHQVEVLSTLFSTAAEAKDVLLAAGFPRNRIPSWSVETALDFWWRVSVELCSGALAYGNLRVLAAAADRYSDNTLLRQYKDWKAPAGPALSSDGALTPKTVRHLEQALAKLTQSDGVTTLSAPTVWTLPEIEAFREAVIDLGRGLAPLSQEYADDLVAHCDLTIVRPILGRIGAGDVTFERLKILYWAEVRGSQSSWPGGESVWSMAVEAAKAALVERADPDIQEPLDALERFVLAVAAERLVVMRATPAQRGLADDAAELLVRWVDSRDHSAAEARRQLDRCAKRKTVLVIDLGDEPLTPGEELWPGRQLTARLYQTDEDGQRSEPVPFGPVTCDREGDLEVSLRELLREVDSGGILIDIVAPRSLLDLDLGRLEILPRGRGRYSALTATHRVRMRWSLRWSDEATFRQLRRMANLVADWRQPSLYLAPEYSGSRDTARTWLETNNARPVLVAAGPATFDVLWEILEDGRGFVVWFPDGVTDGDIAAVQDAYVAITWLARRTVAPDQLADLAAARPFQSRHVIIWDDPAGREGVLPRVALRDPNT